MDLAVLQALLGHDHVDSSAAYNHLAPAHVRASAAGGGALSTDDNTTTTNAVSDDPPHACSLLANPFPQYSSSGGLYGTVHYGGKIVCTGTPGSLSMKIDLLQVVGNGENQHWQLEHGRAWVYGTGLILATPNYYDACLSNNSTLWGIRGYAKYNATNFWPYPGYSGTYTLPCS